jgi:serine/threonine protein kinase
MAPEIFAKKKYDSYIDIWAAGVILFHMLFAVYPFKSIIYIDFRHEYG